MREAGQVRRMLPVDLLVLRVCTIVRGAHGQQHDIAAGGLLEGQGDRDAAALPRQVWLHSKNCRGGQGEGSLKGAT